MTVIVEYFVTSVCSIRVNACFITICSFQFQLSEHIEQFWHTLGVWITEDPLYNTAIAQILFLVTNNCLGILSNCSTSILCTCSPNYVVVCDYSIK